MAELNIEKLTRDMNERLEHDSRTGRTGAVAANVSQHGKDIYTGFFGTTSFNGSTVPDKCSLFRMASMTKPVTTVAFGVLCDKFGVNIDDNLCRYIPQAKRLRMKVLNEEHEVVDICEVDGDMPLRRLLNHTSGIGSEIIGAYYTDHFPKEKTVSLAVAVDCWLDNGVAFYPGSRQCYSPTAAFDVAGRIIEIVSGMSVGEFYKKFIFEPCNMPDTTFTPTEEQWKRIVWMHDNRNGAACEKIMSPGCVFGDFPVSYPLCGGGLISSISDYRNFAQMLLNGGIIGENRIISEEYHHRLSNPTIPEYIQPGDMRWGLGVRVITGSGYGLLPAGAYGWSGAYGTHFWVDPVNDIAAIYLKNSVYGSAGNTAIEFEQCVHNALAE